MSVLIRKILEERFMIDEAIASSTITKEEASKPYHIIKYSKDSLGKYAHHHASYDDYNDATDELLKQKSKAKHSFGGHKIVNSKQLKPLVRLSESQESNNHYNNWRDEVLKKHPEAKAMKSGGQTLYHTGDKNDPTSFNIIAGYIHRTNTARIKDEYGNNQLFKLSKANESTSELDEEFVSPTYTKLRSQAEDQSNAADESYRTGEHHYAAELHVAAAKHAKGEIRKQQHINKALYHFEAAKYC